jgi:hypothetical protein
MFFYRTPNKTASRHEIARTQHASATPRFACQRLHITPTTRHDYTHSAHTSRQRHASSTHTAPTDSASDTTSNKEHSLFAFHTQRAHPITRTAISFSILGHVRPCFFSAHPTKTPCSQKTHDSSTSTTRHDSQVSGCTSRQRHATIRRSAAAHHASTTPRFACQRLHITPAPRQATKTRPCLHFTRPTRTATSERTATETLRPWTRTASAQPQKHSAQTNELRTRTLQSSSAHVPVPSHRPQDENTGSTDRASAHHDTRTR